MKNANLERFVDAYRDACCAPLDDTALKRRINHTLRERAMTSRQRPWLWLFGLGGMLSASLASATPAGRQVVAWIQEQLPLLEQPGVEATSVVVPVRRTPRAETPLSTGSERAEVAPSPVDSTAETELAAGPNLAEVPATLGDEAVREGRGIAKTARRAGRSTPLAQTHAKPTVQTSVNATALYERAFDLQFRHGNHGAAIAAWDDYLATASGGALVGEARFHRAVCLVALGSYDEARRALERIVSGAGGAAYRARAHTLLQAMQNSP